MRFKTVAIVGIVLATLGSIQQSIIAQQEAPEPRLYFFTSSNCGPCKQVKPEVQRLIDKNYPVTTIDVDQRPEVASQFNVDRWPTTLLVYDGRIVQRKSGFIDAPTLANWFADLIRSTPSKVDRSSEAPKSAKVQPRSNDVTELLESSFDDSTVHKGTRTPANDVEFNAMRATVRIKVEDPEGISYATGTVIHCNDGECLVMTCGHVFRESSGKGTISAEYGFESEELKTVSGRLIQYDAGPRDIALIAISPGEDIPPVQVAPLKYPVLRGDQVFSIGCDHGQDATIRRTRVKNQALYDQAKKYDIYGRPVDGRSGGGLFTAGGQLMGVCNAAAVEVDEGVYTSLENMYWQLAETNLEHLVRPRVNAAPSAIAATDSPPVKRLASLDPPTPPARLPSPRFAQAAPITPPRRPSINDVSQERLSSGPTQIPDSQIIVVIQSKSELGQAETVVIDQPSQELLRQLRSESHHLEDRNSDDFARLRREMPLVSPPEHRLSEQFRAQSRK